MESSFVGPIEPPEPISQPRFSYAARSQWVGLGAFAVVGSTAILLFSGVGDATTAGLNAAWRDDRSDSALPRNSDARLPSGTVYAVTVDGLPAIGPTDAKVTLVVVTDYACVGCERARPVLSSLRASYGADLRIVYKPHAEPKAMPSAVGACAAALQGEFERYDRAMWRTGIEKSRSLGVPIALPDAAKVMRVARDVGLDLTRFASGVRRCEATVLASTRDLVTLGVGAPAYFVNGRMVDPSGGIETIGTFQTLIDDELAHARRRIAAGATAVRYYQQWVLDVGHTSR